MLSRRHILTAAMTSPLWAAPWAGAQAAGGVGSVVALSGGATVRRGGQVQPLLNGAALFAQDLIQTAADGQVSVSFADQTLLAVGPGAELRIDHYVFSGAATGPAAGRNALSLSANAGAFRMVSGLIAKSGPEATAIRTPLATIGVRGTDFAVELGGDKPGVALLPPKPRADGSIPYTEVWVVTKAGASVLNRPGEGVDLLGDDRAPSAPAVWSATRLNALLAKTSLGL